MKYRAKIDIPPNVKAGDIVEVNDELQPAYKNLLEKVGDDEEVTERDDEEKITIVNPSRDELKARATELEIVFAPNIPTDRLIELIKEAEDKRDDKKDDE